ncbi:unnamed protein product [Schistocephalus solidus]|uniref:BZIP_Maf domain-containing protein n=1 Tax=Schistocephalus solidus TaxID=70667 RepID=A0A183SR75_SCHSO|nr:unnamed protein product [Schistocephalus solidus]
MLLCSDTFTSICNQQGVCSTSTTGSTDPVAPVRPFDVPSPLPTAGSESVSVRLSDNLWPVEVKPKLATSHSLTSTEIKPRAPKSGTSSSSGYGSLTNEICTESDPELLVSPTKAVSSYFTQASSQPSLKPFSRTVGYSGASSTASDVHTSVQSEDSADAFCDVLQSPVRNRRKRYSAISSSSSCSEDFPFYGESSSSYANQIRSGRIPIFTGPLSAKLFPPSQPPLASTTPCQPVLKSLSNEMLSHGLPPKTHTRGASSPPPNFERLRGRQRTLTDVSRLAESEDSDTSDAHASDSECYRFPDLPTPPILPPLSGQRQQGQERVSYSYGSSVSKSLNSTLNAGATFQGLKHDPFLDDFSDCSVAPYHSSLSNEQLSETDHSERHIRDVHILERLRVPFTYDEVAYSTNETFREMKATPGLSLDQITAMLDARRRATNRQAAERCRRGKSAARDSLANQLGRLRLERAHLTKRLVRTRKRRQCLRDKLSIAQQTFVQGLMGPDGKYLDPAMWRVQTTSQGELVVVRVVDLP